MGLHKACEFFLLEAGTHPGGGSRNKGQAPRTHLVPPPGAGQRSCKDSKDSMSPALAQRSKQPGLERRIIKNNLQELSVQWALFFFDTIFPSLIIATDMFCHMDGAGRGGGSIPEWLIKSCCWATRSRFEIPLHSPTMSSFFSSSSHWGQPEAQGNYLR